MADVETFRNHIIEANVLDPEGVHHEFVSGMHGRKLDFDVITRGTSLYMEWVKTVANFISEEYEPMPEVVIGVANGTNRIAQDVARHFEGRALGLVSQKDKNDSKILYLGWTASRIIAALKPGLAVVVEDVGTTGSKSVQVARQSLKAGARQAEVVTTWQRRPQLERLMEAGIPYRAIIHENLTTYTPEECANHGFCADGWELIERDK